MEDCERQTPWAGVLHASVHNTEGSEIGGEFLYEANLCRRVNREPEHFDVGTQATFRELVKLYRQWCQPESSSDDEEQRT